MKRQVILDAAYSLFREKGFEGASMSNLRPGWRLKGDDLYLLRFEGETLRGLHVPASRALSGSGVLRTRHATR